MTENNSLLEGIREQIDAVDLELLRMLNRRGELALQVAEAKRRIDGDGAVFYRADREAKVLANMVATNAGPLSSTAVEVLFREIMSACLALQKGMTIAFLGPAGTFTQAAAIKRFGQAARTVPLDSIDGVFREVGSGSADYGVVPVENSTEGVVNHTLDTFVESPLAISGEVQLRIHHHLLSAYGDISRVNRVYSHAQSLAQCRKWLDANMPKVERMPMNSNAHAAKRAAEEPGSAAIAGDVAAKTYGLNLLAENIEDVPENTTRFLIIGRDSVLPSGNDKTSLLLAAVNRPGALYELINPFYERGISMTRIESRPARSGLWEYVFFVDVEGHQDDPNVAAALKEIEGHAALCRVLGSYPRSML